MVLYSFMVHPSMFLCDSPAVCENACYTKTVSLLRVFNDTCTASAVGVNGTSAAAAAALEAAAAKDMFEGVDTSSLLLGATTLVGACLVMYLVATKIRHRKRVAAILRQNNSFRERNLRLARELALTKSQKEEVEAAMGELRARMDGVHRYTIPFSDFAQRSKLGSGSYGDVWLADYTRLGVQVALKKLKVERIDKTMLRKFQNEIEIMAPLEHDAIVRFIGMVWEEPNLCLVLEYVDGGSLSDALRQDARRVQPAMTWCSAKLRVACAVARALAYLQGRDPTVLHRDVKSDNVLLAAGGSFAAKLGDFGEARYMKSAPQGEGVDPGSSSNSDDEAQWMTMVGTPWYLAPEVAKGEDYNGKVDVYSFGVLLLELCHRHGLHEAFKGLAGTAVVHKIITGWRPEVPEPILGALPDSQRGNDRDERGAGAALAAAAKKLKPRFSIGALTVEQREIFRRDHPSFNGDDGDDGGDGGAAKPNASPPARHWNAAGRVLASLVRRCMLDDYRRRPAIANVVAILDDLANQFDGEDDVDVHRYTSGDIVRGSRTSFNLGGGTRTAKAVAPSNLMRVSPVLWQRGLFCELGARRGRRAQRRE